MLRTAAALACAASLIGCHGDDDGDLAGGVTITAASFYQGPEVALVRDGELVLERRAPILEGRAGRIRVTLRAVDGGEERDVVVRVILGDDATGEEVVLEEMVPLGPTAASGVDVYLPLEEGVLATGSSFAAEVDEVDDAAPVGDPIDGVRQPESGSWDLDVREAPRFRVHVLPIEAGGGETPDLTDDALERWGAALTAWLPVREVELTVSPEVLSTDLELVLPEDWTLLLGDLAAWRASAGLDPEVFVYAAIGVPTPLGGGVVGVAATAAVEIEHWRVAAGRMLGDEEGEASLVAHELGHSLGRSHAPCGGAAGPDLNYPYEGASIGVPGIDLRDGALRQPSQFVDFMSYCSPAFVSDYQFGALWSSLTWLESGATARPAGPVDPGIVIDRIPEGAR